MNIDHKLSNKLHGPNALQNRCYMCIQWKQDTYSVVITRLSIPSISQFSRLCNECLVNVPIQYII